ncbi:HmuY family protein [Maribacter sp. X9]|uniref:HmuY family protein n=1 Tax=Maribacter sp. X9 TaxID=3402159 RepID=UPI003AF3DC3D
MKNLLYSILALALIFTHVSCSDDDAGATTPFVIAFENPSLSFGTDEEEKTINLVFSKEAPTDGTVTLAYTTTNATYGTNGDFTTVPSGEAGKIEVKVTMGTMGSSITFNKLQNALEGTEKKVNFSISQTSIPDATLSGNTQLEISFTESAAQSGTISPEVGGPNEPNQVYVDLSSLNQTSTSRQTWDFGFYNGSNSRVIINGSIFMAVAPLDATDIDAVTSTAVADLLPKVKVGTFDPANTTYIDDVTGSLENTAIAEISDIDAENKVYLVNMGDEVGSKTVSAGSVALSGETRGWKKIRILKNGDTYKLYYADLDATEHTEVLISKSGESHFTYFSLTTEEVVTVTPDKMNWDINFTVFTNEIPGAGSYGYADFITTNNLSGVAAYLLDAETYTYTDFSIDDVDEDLFSTDQRAIGSTWRNGGGPNTLPSLKENVFYVLKDADQNIYKIRFTALLNESGERGYPKFEFELL